MGSEFLRNIGTLGSSISSGGTHGWFPIIFWVGIQNAEYELVADRQEGDLDREGAGGAPGGGWEKLNPSEEFVFGGGLTKVLCLYLGSPERCRKKMGYRPLTMTGGSQSRTRYWSGIGGGGWIGGLITWGPDL